MRDLLCLSRGPNRWLGRLRANQRRVGKPLESELLGFYAARLREHRVVYRIIDEERVVRVLRIEHRPDVYRMR